MSKRAKHPMQPIIVDKYGLHRFKANAIVVWLLDVGGQDMNTIARTPFKREDREQFAQLIGYSVQGAGELGYVSDATYEAAVRASNRLKRGRFERFSKPRKSK